MITNKDVEKLKETFVTKEELKNSTEEVKRHFDVVAEDLKHSITLLAEQISDKNNDADEHEKSHETLKTNVSILKTRMTAVEAKI